VHRAQHRLVVVCRTHGGSRVQTLLRLRAYHRGRLVANHAKMVHNHRARFHVALGKHRTGKYRFVLSIDSGGQVGKLTRSVRVH